MIYKHHIKGYLSNKYKSAGWIIFGLNVVVSKYLLLDVAERSGEVEIREIVEKFMLIDLYSPTGYDFIYSFAFNENVDMHFHG
jgi:hypothetical protein